MGPISLLIELYIQHNASYDVLYFSNFLFTRLTIHHHNLQKGGFTYLTLRILTCRYHQFQEA